MLIKFFQSKDCNQLRRTYLYSVIVIIKRNYRHMSMHKHKTVTNCSISSKFRNDMFNMLSHISVIRIELSIGDSNI